MPFKDKKSVEYREPKTILELKALYKLRHEVYFEDNLLNKMVNPNLIFDINPFDLKAWHYGAFDNNKAIAYIRITADEENHFTHWTEELIKENHISLTKSGFTFPFQMYHPDKDWVNNFINSLMNKKVGEVGRLAIHKDYRTGGNVLNDLIESFIDYCKNEKNIETGFGSCTLKLERYYRKFGFKLAQGSTPFVYEGLPEAVIMRFDK